MSIPEFVFSSESMQEDQPKGDPPDKNGGVNGGESENFKLPENQGDANHVEILGPNSVSTDSEEALHGDWLIVRRKKRGGNERTKGVKLDRDKNNGAQSILAAENKHVEIQKKEKAMMGSPHLLTFPSTAVSLSNNAARGKRHDNTKKRARKESQQITQKKDSVEKLLVIDKGPPMHVSESTNVQLSSTFQKERVSSPSQLTSIKSHNNRSDKEVVMKGFDLGTEIIISPDLLGGRMFHGNKGVQLNGKPPDPNALKKQISSSTGEMNIVEDEGRRKERSDVETSGMILDSGQ
ncbi:hypothetical protein RIF29_20953 [Crotalaria pallida]|uniref:Uncharacterized protein n=1 Tax=Crotalaria pallida TaxID=3830 RepID=A0AAN9F6G6_CROPI